jgi:hypothetical protein
MHVEPTDEGSFVIKEEAAPGLPIFENDVEIGRVVSEHYPETMLMGGRGFRLYVAAVRNEGQEPPTYHLRGVYVEAASMWPGVMELLKEHGVRL